MVGVSGSFFSPSAGTFMAHAGNVAVAGAQVLLTRLPLCSYHFQVHFAATCCTPHTPAMCVHARSHGSNAYVPAAYN